MSPRVRCPRKARPLFPPGSRVSTAIEGVGCRILNKILKPINPNPTARHPRSRTTQFPVPQQQFLEVGDVGDARVRSDDLGTEPPHGLEVANEARTLSDVREVRECEVEVPNDVAVSIVLQTPEAIREERILPDALSSINPTLHHQKASTPQHPTNCCWQPTTATRIVFGKRMPRTRLP